LLDRIAIIPYEFELRDAVDAAHYHFDRLESSAQRALELQDLNRRGAQAFSDQTNAQRATFDGLEGFLLASARVSLLFFPIAKTAMAKIRSQTLQAVFSIVPTSPLAARELRDSWMHFDERIDAALATGRRRAGQRFSRSSEITPTVLDGALRVIELDTLTVHYWDRTGQQSAADLRLINAEIVGLSASWRTAFDVLSVPISDA
jgi:hypothetical protein